MHVLSCNTKNEVHIYNMKIVIWRTILLVAKHLFTLA
jgi:hypothetical protein